MRILSFDHTPSKMGGQEIALFEVLTHLNKDHKIELAYIESGELISSYENNNISCFKIRSFTIINKINPVEWFNFFYSVIKIKLSKRFDILYINQIMDLPIAAILKVLSKNKKIICHLRLPPLGYNLKKKNNQLGLFLKYVDAFIVANEVMYEAHTESGIPKEKTHIIFDGIKFPDLPYRTTSNNIKPKILKIAYLGRIDPSKGILEAVKYLKLCKDNGMNFHFTIGGTPQNENQIKYKNQILAYTTNNNLSDNISFAGFISNPYKFFENFDLTLFPSTINESFGRTIVESLIAGTPVIANNVGWVKNILNDQNLEWIYNDQEEFVKIIYKFYNNPFNYNLKAKQDYVYNKFNITNVVTKIDNLFNSIGLVNKTK